MNETTKSQIMIALADIETIKWDTNKAKRLRELRGDRTLREIASSTGITFQYLGRLENAKQKSISMSVLISICRALDADISFIVPSH